MNILFVADIHIKIGQKNVPVEWAKKRYTSFINQLAMASTNCDMVIIGGDVFDRVPSLEEIEIYFDLVRAMEVPTLIYDGNHEASKKGKTFLSYLKGSTKAINDKVSIVDEVTEYTRFTIVPYCKILEKNVFSNIDDSHIVFTHVRGEIPPHVKPEIDLDLLAKFPLVVAGDLHSHSNSQRNIVYPGSPMSTSFHRTLIENGYIIVNTVTKEYKWYAFNLPQLVRKTVSCESEMVGTTYHHTIYEVEGDIMDLSGVLSSELLDKKIVKKSSEVSLILDKTMTLEDELVEYFRYILNLPEDKIEGILKVYHDYSKRS